MRSDSETLASKGEKNLLNLNIFCHLDSLVFLGDTSEASPKLWEPLTFDDNIKVGSWNHGSYGEYLGLTFCAYYLLVK